MPDASSDVAEALAAVRAAVAELQEANFDGIEGYSQAKATINTALQVAKEKGASAQELLEAGRVEAVDIDDAASAGAAARKARKLRLLERQFANRHRLDKERRDKEKQEQERAARVAERLALRRGGPEKERLERERLERERQEKEQQEAQRAERLAQKLADRRAKAKSQAEAGDSEPTPAPSRSRSRGRRGADASPAASRPGRGCRVAGASPAAQRPARGRSSETLPARAAQAEPRQQKQLQLQQQSLSALLGRPHGSPDEASSPDGEASAPKSTTADVPLHVMIGGSSATTSTSVTRIGASDLSTGGEQVCFNFTVGKCSRWNCRFKHIGRT